MIEQHISVPVDMVSGKADMQSKPGFANIVRDTTVSRALENLRQTLWIANSGAR